ncbi:MAG: bifunctional oligoribonuclease/PAP phosphatase NrnA [Ignavibacteriales bacterium]|nr:MAG: bifunctional oligoribonuclease/PAP phosphatase NrnA [Ignavibacteriaceae bacterium]MBW7872005.1 bifunctional oligoribonuclease/PAP phosphatase NrnA [Ignavibacteria bacterium]MCZ2144101.1 bifunctional oligoribonuclease/PAP phosphatase NrnA [Ignavibacteriales bacterium]OQY74456.1 MAG: hypothetical protein B6D45_06910 [Ignavibacteriales bacterium UTCHB3]MBV6446099.1 Bifunctional oligoribonuclease and PAP phosphatase NrnA [Ignavibacteriaceae bacterium]
MTKYNELLKIIKENNSFLITSHVNPDADAIGSEIAVWLLLKRLGKMVKIVNFSTTPDFLEFLDAENVIEKYSSEAHDDYFLNCNVVISLDFNNPDRTVKMAPLFEKRDGHIVCIDHHLEPVKKAFTLLISRPRFAATAHIIYDFIIKTKVTAIDKEIALPIYAGITTDTGSFKYERTTPALHRIAAKLLETGIKPIEVNDYIFGQDSLSKFALLGRALNSLKVYGDNGRLAVMTLDQNDFAATSALESDTEGFINLCMAIKGVKLGAIFIDLREGFKVSLRSKKGYDIRKIAAHFDGGGHKHAAGIRIRTVQLDAMQNEIINYILENAKEEEEND